MKSGKDEKRTEKRSSLRIRVDYMYEPVGCELAGAGPWKTFTTDISFNGMGLYSECPAQVGQKIEIYLKNVCAKPIIAEVRWCKKHSDNLYKIGIRYCVSPRDFIPQN